MPLQVATDSGAAAKQEQSRLVPFVRAAHRVFEPAFDVSTLMTTSTITLGPYDVPARGFLRDIVLLVTSSGGVIGTGVLHADAPWTAISSVELIDTNGYPIVSPLTGYQLYLANLLGAYRGFNDPTAEVSYSNTINPSFVLRIPAEITAWDGFGALQNQSASAPFRVRITLGKTADLLGTVGTATVPTVRIRGFLEAYSQPSGVDMFGHPTEVAPPGHGAVQYWSVSTPSVSASKMNLRLTRTGNLIRNLAFIHRDASGLRSDTVMPTGISLTWDSAGVIADLPTQVHRAAQRQAFGFDFPTGVLVFPFTDDQDGKAGYESRHLYLPTVGSTRLEYIGTFGAAGTVEILTNDVAVTALGR